MGGFKEVVPLGNVSTVRLHAYTIFAPPDAAYMLSMRNPWGANRLTAGGMEESRDGVLDVPAHERWSSIVDLRIIDAKDALGSGRTTPYAPPGTPPRGARVEDF